jgi:hypothetical protein
MCCILTVLLFLGPRATILVWFLLQPLRWRATFDTFIWPLLGSLFMPWTTLAYVLVAPRGVHGLEWVLIVLAVLGDLGMYAGGGYGNRGRV